MTTAYTVALKETLPETSVAPRNERLEVVKRVPKFFDSEERAKRLARRLNALLISGEDDCRVAAAARVIFAGWRIRHRRTGLYILG